MRLQFRQRSSGTRKFGEKVFLTFFFGIFALVGSGLLVALGTSTWQTIMVYGWNETPCTITASTMDAGEGVESGPGWQVRYRYLVAGQSYESTAISGGMWSRDFSTDLRLSQQFVPGESATCHVNPGRPDEAVLLRPSLWGVLWGFFPLPFVAVGFGGLYFIWRRRPATEDVTAVTAPVTSVARADKGRAGALFAVVFFGGFLLLGCLFTWILGVKPLLRVFAAEKWSEVPCTVVSSGVEEHDSDDGTTYSVRIVYRYEINGRSYTADRYKFFGGSSSGRAGKAAVVARFPAGTAAVCYVNPADPTDAVIERGYTADMAFGLIPLVFVLVGAGGLVGFVVKRSRGSGAATFTRDPRRSLHPSATAFDAMGSPAGAAGPVVLETRGSRTVKFVGLTFFALIWNGIVSVFVASIITDWSRGGGISWFMALFLIPFVGVGLMVLGMAIHAGLAIFNPRPRLFVSSSALAPGGTLDLRWEMLGSTQRLQRFRIELEGREEATYRRGTSTHTDKHVFARIALADARDPSGISAGSARAQLPADTMHSFNAKNNKVVWTLHVRGDIPRWPDVDDEFPFTVLAEVGPKTAER